MSLTPSLTRQQLQQLLLTTAAKFVLQDQRDSRVALVPCGHVRFCEPRVTTVLYLVYDCIICRSTIYM